MPGKKATDIEKQKRVLIVQQWLIEGVRSPIIVKNIKEQWGISESQAYKYIDLAWQGFAEKYMKDRDALLAFHIAARINLFRKAYEREHWGVCRSILEDIAKLQGLYVQKHAFTDPSGELDYGALTADEIVKRLLAVLSGEEEYESN